MIFCFQCSIRYIALISSSTGQRVEVSPCHRTTGLLAKPRRFAPRSVVTIDIALVFDTTKPFNQFCLKTAELERTADYKEDSNKNNVFKFINVLPTSLWYYHCNRQRKRCPLYSAHWTTTELYKLCINTDNFLCFLALYPQQARETSEMNTSLFF